MKNNTKENTVSKLLCTSALVLAEAAPLLPLNGRQGYLATGNE